MLEAEIARAGILTNYGDSAMLRTESADGNSSIIAFVVLDAGKWKVTAGPKTIDTTPVEETAPPIAGAAILEHEIGQTDPRLRQGDLGREDRRRAGLGERLGARQTGRRVGRESARRATPTGSRRLPAPAVLADQIRSGGKLSFVGEKAYSDRQPERSHPERRRQHQLLLELHVGAVRARQRQVAGRRLAAAGLP